MVPKRCCVAAMPGFKSQRQSSSATPFLTPPTIGHSCQHSHIFPALLGCHSKSGQVWPYGVEPIISKLSHRSCIQRELPPSYIMGGSHSHPPWLKAWPQLFNISMKPVKSYRYVKRPTFLEVICKTVPIHNSSHRPFSMPPIPQLRLVRVKTSYRYIFSNISWTPSSGPHYKSLFGAPPWLYPVTGGNHCF